MTGLGENEAQYNETNEIEFEELVTKGRMWKYRLDWHKTPSYEQRTRGYPYETLEFLGKDAYQSHEGMD